jgi:nucleotide-binding universal stress UspA family protein
VTDANDNHAEGRIVVGVDGSDESKAALRWAARQAALTGATLHAVLTWHVPTAAYGAALPLSTDYDFGRGAHDSLAETLSDVLGEHPALSVSTAVVEGAPAVKLLEEAVDAELLVVGSRGHGAFTGMLLGSVSEHCISHANCPVVVVRHDAPGA